METNPYTFPRVAVMLALSVVIGLLGAKCKAGDSGDTNNRPKCDVQNDGTKDCRPPELVEQRFGGGA